MGDWLVCWPMAWLAGWLTGCWMLVLAQAWLAGVWCVVCGGCTLTLALAHTGTSTGTGCVLHFEVSTTECPFFHPSRTGASQQSSHRLTPPRYPSTILTRRMARSQPIAPHVGRYSRSQVAAKRGLHKGELASGKTRKIETDGHGWGWQGSAHVAGKKTSTAPAKEEKPTTVEKKVGGKANGENRTISTNKASKYYPAEDVKTPRVSRKSPGKTQLRGSITPGTVVILLAGRFAGKRAVFLKQLDSGLLLVTGPFK